MPRGKQVTAEPAINLVSRPGGVTLLLSRILGLPRKLGEITL
jgi:hypothetical protein